MLHTRFLNTLRPLGLFGAASLFSMTFIGNAHAEAEPAGGGIASFVPLILIMVIFYFLLIRPQQKRAKEHKNLIAELKKGDKVVTGGGIYGTIAKVKEGLVELDIADGVRVKVKADTISALAE